jgi:hypothetical protein
MIGWGGALRGAGDTEGSLRRWHSHGLGRQWTAEGPQIGACGDLDEIGRERDGRPGPLVRSGS